MRRSKISPSQLSEWTESAVTTELILLIKKEIATSIEAMSECFTPFDAAKTQELMASQNGARDTWDVVLEVLEGDWRYFGVEEDDE